MEEFRAGEGMVRFVVWTPHREIGGWDRGQGPIRGSNMALPSHLLSASHHTGPCWAV